MTTEEKFEAAVNVIRNLPKNGAYQPSNELQLRFYAYYKQATEGPCHQQKPAFWEVVRKAKWDAWMKLGNMSRNEAMNNYVEELKKIVETMSYTDNVANFLGSLESFYENVPAEDLEMLVGPVLERMRSQPGSPLSGSPLGSRETSPHRAPTSRHITSSLETSPVSSHSASPLPPDTDGEEDEFKDTVEAAPEKVFKDCNSKSSIGVPHSSKTDHQQSKLSNGYASENPVEVQYPERGRKKDKKDKLLDEQAEFRNHIANTLLHLQRDLDRITGRVRSLEGQALKSFNLKPRSAVGWWPFADCSAKLLAIIILWPFVAQFIVNLIRNRPRKS